MTVYVCVTLLVQVVAHVVDDLRKTTLPTHSPASTGDLYRQTPQDSNLYGLMQHLHSLSISED